MDGGFFTSLPAGYRFKPKDEELVDYYLKRKIYNRPLPPNLFRDVDLYNYDPHTLTAMNDNASSNGVVTEWYFFTSRERRHPNDKRPIRTAGDGCWKATGKAKPAFSRGEKIGTKRSLVFFRGKKTDWLMHEYVLTKAPQRQRLSSQDMQLDDWVLCRVYKKKEQKTKPGTPVEETTADKVVAHTESEAQVLGDGISPDGLNTLMRQHTCSMPIVHQYPESFGSMLGPNPASFNPREAVSNNGNFIPMPTPMASMPPPQQFSGVYPSNDCFGLDTTQEEGDMGAVVGQGEVQMLGNGIAPIAQYQEFEAGFLNTPMLQQQQQLLGVNQSQPLQQQQLSGVNQSLQLPEQQFSGANPSNDWFYLDTTQDEDAIGPVVGQSVVQMLGNGIAPIDQYQGFDAGSLNTPKPQQQQVPLLQQQQVLVVNQSQPLQQQQPTGVDQSQQLQHQQFSGVYESNLDFTVDELDFTVDEELGLLLGF